MRETSIHAKQTIERVIGMEAEPGVTYTEAPSVIDAALVRMGLHSGPAKNAVVHDDTQP